MGILDDLKKQAEIIRARGTEAASPAGFELRNSAAVRAAMGSLCEHLTDLADQLNTVDPEVKVSHAVRGHGALANLRQQNYRLVKLDEDSIDRIAFQFECIGQHSLQFWIDSRTGCEDLKAWFNEHGLRYRWRNDGDWRFIFVVDPWVAVSFEFGCCPEEEVIKLKLKNLNTLGVTSHSFQPGQINEELIDELAKLAVRKPNRFAELSGNLVSVNVRKQFQEKIEARKREREAQLST